MYNVTTKGSLLEFARLVSDHQRLSKEPFYPFTNTGATERYNVMLWVITTKVMCGGMFLKKSDTVVNQKKI